MKKLIPILLFLNLFIISCGQSDDEKIDSAISHANQLLSSSLCADAIAVLDGIGYQNLNSRYLQTYSSAQACLAGYSTIDFFASDVDKIYANDANFIGSLTLFTTSPTTSLTSGSFLNLKNAINTLLFAGSTTSSSTTNRRAIFLETEIQAMNSQLLYMVLVQMGKYFEYYGNPSAAGLKGGGAGGNNCLADYTEGTAPAIRAGLGAAISPCVADNDGHADLDGAVAATTRQSRMCEGIILFNNFTDILASLTFTGGNSGDIELLKTLSDYCVLAGLGNVCSVKTLSECEDTANVTFENAQLFFLNMFENMFTDAAIP